MSLFLCSNGEALRLLLRDRTEPLTWLTAEPVAGHAPDLGRPAGVCTWDGQDLAGLTGILIVALDPSTISDASRRAVCAALQRRLADGAPVVITAEALALAAAQANEPGALLIPSTHVAPAPLPDNLGPVLLHQYGVRRLLVLCGTVTACYDAFSSVLDVQGPGCIFAATLSSTAQLATIPLSVHVLGGGMHLPW